MTLGFAVVLAALPTAGLHAQGGYFPLQSFTGNICGWTALGGTTLTYDPTHDNTGNGGGSCRIVTDYSQSGTFIVNAANVSCCNCMLEALLTVSNFTSLEFDVMWDNSSTVPLSWFNANYGGATQGISVGNGAQGYGIGSSLCYSNIIIPDAATNGWAHVSAAFNPAFGSVTFVGLTFQKLYPGYGSGTSSAFWVDNVRLIPRVSLAPPSCGDAGFTLRWTAFPGATYSVLRTTNMVTWETLATGYPAGGAANGPLTFTETNGRLPRAFYRVTCP
jgi:hypothetical protein